jgi:choline dehydrogenase
VVAGELAAAGKRVLLLEAGPSADEHPETLRADGYKDAFVNDAIFYERFSAPQRGCAGNRVFLGTGAVIGGSGAVNGMVYTRGAREDYDAWPEGWRWADVVPFFERLEARLRVRPREPTRWTEACIASAVARGFEHRADLNDGDLSNAIGYETMSYEGGTRRSSYVAFVREAALPTLEVHTGARVQRIEISGRRATAVAYRHGGVAKIAPAREVILCAGALETPKLLLLSGVGPGEELRRHGIEVVADVPELGKNLHDHPNVPVFFRWNGRVDCHYPQLYSFFRTHPRAPLPPRQSDTCYVFWPAPSAMKEAMQRMLPAQVLPERLYQGSAKRWLRRAIALAFGSRVVQAQVNHLYAVVVILGKPCSRGTLRLRDRDASSFALVDPAYFDDARDLETMVRGVRLARDLALPGSFELMPGPWVKSDDAIARWVRKNTITTYHFAGTCRMGTDPGAVVDTRLRLRGVEGVRVADASVVPVTPVSAMNAPSMLVGLRAARFALDQP